MRRFSVGVLAAMLAIALGWSASPAPAAAAVSSDPKVVLVVGATHATTATYRSWMNVVATTASRYSRNVVKVYSPNATYAAVKTALQGASVVVYMGHGNGFPSPYSTTPNPYTQNGMGLNLAAGAGDSNTKYYGESYFARDVDLAPNAVVILSHNCYASGNSEPGKAEPSLAVAKARIDNFAAGFLRAGARAVIADGHADPSWYITQLFTTHRTIEQIWRSGPSPRGNVFSFASARTPGFTAFSDPDHRSGTKYSGFYRSMVAKPTLTSDQVTGARYARTDAHPGFFVVPGAAEVTAVEGVGLYADAALTPDSATGLAPAQLAVGTRLRVRAAAGKTAAGAVVYDVATLDGSASGFVAATGLAPRDSASPRIWELSAGTGAFSPNGDSSGDTISLSASASESVAWRIDIVDAAGASVARLEAQGGELAAAWDGLVGGAPVSDGTYTATVSAADGWGNAPTVATIPLVVDTVAPSLNRVGAEGAAAAVFTPNGDGVTDVVRLAFGASEAGTVEVGVVGASGATVDQFSSAMASGSGSAAWDGRTSAGGYAPDGAYTVSMRPVDRAGNHGAPIEVGVVAYGALGYVTSSVTAFYPNDGDAYAKTTTLSFRLRAPATVTWQLLNAAGAPLITRLNARAMASGSYSWTWNGRLPSGAWAPRGVYTSRLIATDGITTVRQDARFTNNAFRLVLSDSTPARGQLITANVVSTEPLRAAPRLTYTQPGRSPVTVTMTKTSTYGYRATFRLATSARTGPLVIRIAGNDRANGYNWAAFTYAIH